MDRAFSLGGYKKKEKGENQPVLSRREREEKVARARKNQ